jgi:hypothetical protein
MAQSKPFDQEFRHGKRHESPQGESDDDPFDFALCDLN